MVSSIPDSTADSSITRGTKPGSKAAGWQAVDPTLGQLNADATHVKLIEGESLAQLAPLAGMVGKARVESARALARW